MIEDISQQLKDMTFSVECTGESVGKELGRGSYGRVYTVKCRGLLCAAKEVHSILLEGAEEDQQCVKDRFLHECQRCNVLRHPNLVRFLGIFYPENASLDIPTMLMEMMDESLYEYIKKQKKDTTQHLLAKGSILLDVAEGLCYLHTQNPAVIHRDLSPNNILLKWGNGGEVQVAKIADLGVARIIQVDSKNTQDKLKRKYTRAPGTVDFMPPESLGVEPEYNTSLDVFSYGAIMLFVANHKWPTPADQVKLDRMTKKPVAFSEVERRLEYLDTMPKETQLFRPLIESCLNDVPSDRPTMKVVSEKIKVYICILCIYTCSVYVCSIVYVHVLCV